MSWFTRGSEMRSGRDSVLVKAGKVVQWMPLGIFRWMEAPFTYVLYKAKQKPVMLIICALPRSGSTLTYQVLTHGLRTQYISNLWNVFYKLPLLGGMLSSLFCRRYYSDFISSNGFVRGICGPAEAMGFWKYWLNYGLDERKKGLSEQDGDRTKFSYLHRVLAILSSNDQPIVTGYIGHILDITRLQKEFPEAIYIRVYRDPLSTAQSLLDSRREADGDWFSLFPYECESVIGAGEHKEIASQVYWLNKRIDDELKGENVFHITYEDLCANPAAQLEELKRFCLERGVRLVNGSRLPESFKYRLISSKSSPDAELLSLELGAVQSQYGKLLKFGVRADD